MMSDLDDAIADILGDSDEETLPPKKKQSSKKKSSKSSSKTLTSSVNDEKFHKNLSKESKKQNIEEDFRLTEEDAKKMAGNLAGLDDLDSDLLGSLSRKKLPLPKSTPGHDLDKKGKNSSGSLHRKGSVTPFTGEDELSVLDNNLVLSDDDDVLNSSMNSSTSKHRKVSPNKISPRISTEDIEQDVKSKKLAAKSINSESDDKNEPTKKPSSKSRQVKKIDDLFGEDDELPDLDSAYNKSSKTKAASALDNLMGKNDKSSEDKKSRPASFDEFMANVSTASKTEKSPVSSPAAEDSFQFGQYMPSASSGRRSRARPESRSVKFSDDFDDDILKRRPSTAPGSQRKKHEHIDPLNKTFSVSSNKNKADWLSLDKKTAPQSSKSSADWLGLGDDVIDEQINVSSNTGIVLEAPENVTTPQNVQEKRQDHELASECKTSESSETLPWESQHHSTQQNFSNVLQNKTSENIPQSTPLKTLPFETSTPSQDPGEDSGFSSAPLLPTTQQSKLVPVPSENLIQTQPVSQSNQYHSEKLRSMLGNIQGVKDEKYEVNVQMQDEIAELEKKIRRLEVENDSLKQSLELSKQRNKEDVEALEKSYRNRVESLEEFYQRREARQKEETEVLVTKHKDAISQIEREKADMQTAHALKISTLETSKLSEIERLQDQHRRALHEVRSEHEMELKNLKKLKEQEISATTSTYSNTKSLQDLMGQVLNSTRQVEDMHRWVEASHKSSQEERDISMRSKDEYLDQLQTRLLKQQTENDEERNRLRNIIVKMEVQVREQSRKFEEDKWKLSQEDLRLRSLRESLEGERRVTREHLEAERALIQKTKEEFLSQQRKMLIDINEERKTLALERAELTSAQRGLINSEKQKNDDYTKLDAEQENARVRLAQETATLSALEARLKQEQEALRRDKRIFVDKKDQWSTEKERIERMGLELQKRAREIDELSLEAANVREEGIKALELTERMQGDISQQAAELEARVLLLQEKERQIADDRLALVKEKREIEGRRETCSRCSRSQSMQGNDPRESSVRLALGSSPHYIVELGPSPMNPTRPDVLANTLDLKRTLRRWSHDKEQDEEFLAKESEFLSSLQDSRRSSLSESIF